MSNLDFYKIVAIISPIFAAILTSTITHYFTLKSKKFDLLYQNKISEYKNIVTKLVEYKMFCVGRIAYYQGNEYSPTWEEGAGTLMHRTEIYKLAELNSFYLSQKSKDSIKYLIDEMSILCNAEVWEINGEKGLRIDKAYEMIIEKTETCIKTIYKDLA